VGHHFLHMELLLTAIVAGLLVGLVYCLVKVRVREPSVFALIGVVVMLLGQITAYVYPFGVGLLLGLAYDTFEEEWYGSAIADSARFVPPSSVPKKRYGWMPESVSAEWTPRGQTNRKSAQKVCPAIGSTTRQNQRSRPRSIRPLLAG
jgi:XapX domain-containing protein